MLCSSLIIQDTPVTQVPVTPQDIIAATSVLALLVSGTTAFVVWRNARRQELGFAQWLRDLREWASEAIDTLSEAHYACKAKDSSPSDISRCIYRLSALIDRGRFFLPNRKQTTHENDKPLAYQGNRHLALAPLILALNVLEGEVPDYVDREFVMRNRPTVMRELQREFVSHIYLILGPEQYNRAIANLIKTSDEQVEALLKSPPGGRATVLGRVEKRVEKRVEESQGNR